MDADAKRVLDQMAQATREVSQPAHLRGDAEWVAQYRDQILQMRPLAGPPEPVFEQTQFHFEGPDGPLDLRVYRPGPGVLPALIWFHGGGFVAGSLETHDPALRTLANATGAVVIAVEYRRAPEHVFPAAPEDAFATLAHVADHTGLFGVDPARLVVGGDSAGGCLATVVAAMARDRSDSPLAGQICLYPNTDLRIDRSYPSMAEFDGTIVKLPELHRSLRLYLAGADPAHPYASPVLAPDLAGLPPALIVTCECDPLRDEGVAYAKRLREAGVVVRRVALPGMIHGVMQMAGEIPAGRALAGTVAEWLRGLG